MRIAYTSEYSGSKVCGVWARVREESEYMKKKGHEVKIFSSDIYKPWLRLSSNVSFWAGKKFKEDMLSFKPDIIVCNTYRHPETNVCLDLAKKMKVPCVLVTHAPFDRKRGWKLSLFALIYDTFFNRLSEFDAVFAISNWEIPYLERLGSNIKNITVVPNAISDEFFSAKIKKGEGVFFFGRNDPIKDLPTLYKACDLVGIKPNIIDNIPPEDIKAKIKMFQSYNVFVLPSKQEGIPKSLLEAMAMGKICISSMNNGGKELIKPGVNGLLFRTGDDEMLAGLIALSLYPKINRYGQLPVDKIRKEARKTAKQFAASVIYPRTEQLYWLLVNGIALDY